MSVEAQKNNVAFGYILYFVGLSVLGWVIYQWSQPLPVVEQAPRLEPKASTTVLESEEGVQEEEVVSEGVEASEEDAWN